MLFRSFLFWLSLVVLTPPLTMLTFLLQLLLRDARSISHKIASFWGRCVLTSAGVKVTVRNLDAVPQGPVVFMGNHRSYMDIFVLYAALGRRPFSWLAKKELFDIPILGWGMKRAGYIPIDRRDLRRAALSIKAAAEAIRGGRSVVVFPEGTRGKGRELLPFKPGGFEIAIKSGVPIVPFVIKGTEDVMAKGSWLVRPGQVELVFLEPVETKGLKSRDRSRLMEKVRKVMEDELRKG